MTINLCEKFLLDNYKCTIALRRKHGDLLLQLNENIEVVELADESLTQFVPSLSKLLSDKKPIAVITAFPDIGLLTWLAIKKSKIKTKMIHGVHDTHRIKSITPGLTGLIRKILFIVLASIQYKISDELVAVSKGVGNELRDIFKIAESKIHVIYNPIIPDEKNRVGKTNKDVTQKNDNIEIIALGRLAHQKGFDLLIKAMHSVKKKDGWSLSIYGDGPEHKYLQNLIDQLGLEKLIKLKGFTNDPFGMISSADLFVMPSRHEGFGNVLVEALSCGVQVIAADCPHGPREILADGKYGSLIPAEDIISLAEKISEFLEGKIQKYENGIERANQFTFSASYAQWKSLVDQTYN